MTPALVVRAAAVVSTVAAALAAQEPGAAGQDPGEELLMFRDIPVVISGARTETPIDLSPVAVSVLTATDIQLGGQQNLYDALQFLPGIDMLRIDRNRYALGIRGLHDVFSDRTIALIDGRSASSPVFGGPEFLRLPLSLEDIERVEVVRGPGGAAWGANAFNGVINIITKAPGEDPGLLVDTHWNEFGDSQTTARWSDRSDDGDLAWRLSTGWQDLESSSAALTGESFDSADYRRGGRVEGELLAHLDADTTLRGGAGYSGFEEGPFEVQGYLPTREGTERTFRAHLRLDHSLSPGTEVYVQAYATYQDDDLPSLGTYDSLESDLEVQLSTELSAGHTLTVGGNVHYLDVDDNSQDLLQIRTGNVAEAWAGLFVIDRLQLDDSFTVEGQLRGDYSSQVDEDWSGRLTGFLVPTRDRRHTFRLSVARAFREPLPTLRNATFVRPPFTSLVAAPDLDNEEIVSFELGYALRPTEGLMLRLEGYYQEYEDLIGTTIQSPGPPVLTTLANARGASALGSEIEVEWNSEPLRLVGWYACNDFDTDASGQDVRAFAPARHKVGLGCRVAMPHDLTVDLNYRYSSETERDGLRPTRVPDHHRLDLAFTKRFCEQRGEFQLGISDLFDDTELAIDSLASTGHLTPGRTFFAQIGLRF